MRGRKGIIIEKVERVERVLTWQTSKQVRLEINGGKTIERITSRTDIIDELELTQPNSNQANLYFLIFSYVQSFKCIQMLKSFYFHEVFMKTQKHVKVKSRNSIWGCDLNGITLLFYTHRYTASNFNTLGLFSG